jgi:transcriptional regulator with XRE-family HTH domain
MDPEEAGPRVARLRRAMGMGLRELSRQAGVSLATLSALEKGESSPTLATLHKVLKALRTDFAGFFAPEEGAGVRPVFAAADMRSIEDADRRYTLLLPKRADIRFGMMLEEISAAESEAEWELHDCDMAGVVLAGGPMRLEFRSGGCWPVGRGDAFYVSTGTEHRGINAGRRPLKLLTAWHPPRY